MKRFVAGMLMTGIVGGMGSAPVAGQVPSGAAFNPNTWGPPVAPWRKPLDHDLLQRPLNPSGPGTEPVLPGGTVKPWADGSMDRDLLFRAGEDKSRVMQVVPAASASIEKVASPSSSRRSADLHALYSGLATLPKSQVITPQPLKVAVPTSPQHRDARPVPTPDGRGVMRDLFMRAGVDDVIVIPADRRLLLDLSASERSVVMMESSTLAPLRGVKDAAGPSDGSRVDAPSEPSAPSEKSLRVSALDPAAMNHPVFQGPVEDRFSVLAHAPWWLRVEAAALESAPVPGRGEISLVVCDGFRVPTREEMRAARIQAALRDAALRESRSPRPEGTASPP